MKRLAESSTDNTAAQECVYSSLLDALPNIEVPNHLNRKKNYETINKGTSQTRKF